MDTFKLVLQAVSRGSNFRNFTALAFSTAMIKQFNLELMNHLLYKVHSWEALKILRYNGSHTSEY